MKTRSDATKYHCFQYITKKLSTDQETQEFSKNFFQFMLKEGFCDKEVIMMHTSLNLNSLDKNITPEKYYEKVITDTSIKLYKDCRDYCKHFQPELTQCCKVCVVNQKNANRRMKEEASVIRFIADNFNNLQWFLQRKSSLFFRSMYDFAGDTVLSDPFIITVFRECFKQIKEQGTSFYLLQLTNLYDQKNNTLLDERSELKNRIYNLFPNIIAQTSKKLSYGELHQSSIAIDKIFELKFGIISEQIMNTPLLSTNQIQSILDGMMLQDVLKHNLCVSTINEKPKVIDETLCVPSSECNAAEESLWSIHNAVDNSMAEPNLKKEPDAESNPLSLRNGLECEDLDQTTMDLEMEKMMDDAKDAYIPPFYMLPVVCDDMIKILHEIDPNNEKILEIDFRKDYAMPIECCSDTSGRIFFLVWNRKRRMFYFQYTDKISKRMENLLHSSNVCKICYCSYLLYSICKGSNKKIQNVYSIYSIDRFFSDRKFDYLETMEYFSHKSLTEEMDNSEILQPEYFIGMPYYRCAKAQLQKEEKYSGKNYDIRRIWALDEIIGNSFCRNSYSNDSSYLLDYDDECRLVYTVPDFNMVYREGYLVKYSICDDYFDNDEKENIFFRILIYLAEKGRIRKYHIYLVSMLKGEMCLFIEKCCYELIDTLITVKFHKYAKQLQIHKMNLRKQILYLKENDKLDHKMWIKIFEN